MASSISVDESKFADESADDDKDDGHAMPTGSEYFHGFFCTCGDQSTN